MRTINIKQLENKIIKLEKAVEQQKKTITKQVECETLFQSMFQSSPDIILTINTDCSILYLNRPVSGLSVKKAVGKNIFTVFMPDKKDALARLIQSVLKTGKTDSFEYNDSFNNWWMVRLVPIMEKGATNKIMIVSSCITKQKHTEIALRESEEHHRALFLDSPINTITVDHHGRVTGYNKQIKKEGGGGKN